MKLRLLTKSDLPTRVEWMNNPLVYKTMHFTPPISLDKTLEWHLRNENNNSRCDVAFEDDNGNLVAMGGLTNIDPLIGKAELYIFVNPKRQGEGIGTMATSLLCQYGFNEVGLNKIYLYTNYSNCYARHTYEKVGFALEGIQRNEVFGKNGYEDRLYYGILKSDFISSRRTVLSPDIILERYDIDNREIYMVRDDLFPYIGGGVKARKSLFYEQHMRENGYNACVTTGGIQSNHNRAIAIMCAKNGWKCHLVIHGSENRFDSENGNALLIRKSGSSKEFVKAEDIGSAMDAAMIDFHNNGYRPLYIHGGGHDIFGGMALVEAVKKLKYECEKMNYKPKYIFHASGTGSTQAGITVGLDLVGWSDVNLIGISVARQKERGTKIIEDFANHLAKYYGLEKDYQGKINLNTDFLFDGYEKSSFDMEDYLNGVMKHTGVMFDTTYSGKAFYGMMKLLANNNDKVLFWHTGGLMNLMK